MRASKVLATLLLALALLSGCRDSGGLGIIPGGSPGDDDASGDDDDTAPLDEDGDGFLSDEDCDDSDPDVHPGADEVPDGIDDDCDGTVDEIDVCDDDVGDHATIQAAIDAAPDGAVIDVCPGTYFENLLVDGKRLTVRSTGGPATTTVDGGGLGTTWIVLDVPGTGLAIRGFTITGGLAPELGGGGLRCRGAVLEVDDCTVTTNQGALGGGLLATGCDLAVHGSRLAGNTATGYGGGAYVEDCTGEVTGNEVAGNSAGEGGGLAVVGDQLDVTGNEVHGNQATTTIEYGGGGGIWLAGSSPLRDNDIHDNATVACGGGVYVNSGSGEISGNTVRANACGDDGAGVYLYVSDATVSGNLFEGNTSSDDAGGLRIFVSSVVVEGNEFLDNAANDDGGAVKFSHLQSVFLDNYLEGNSTGDAGGGVELDNDRTEVAGCTFVGNQAGRGGALHASAAEGEVSLHDNWFEGNGASGCGGAVEIDAEAHTVFVSRTVLLDNAADSGGALCAFDAVIDVSNVIMAGNTASTGGAMALERVAGSVGHAVLAGNAAGAGSAARLASSPGLSVRSSIVHDNDGGAAITAEGEPPASWSHNDIAGNGGGAFSGMDDPTGTAGNLDLEPQFVDSAAFDFHLLPGSPCVDAGAPGAMDTDGTPADMGAYGGPYGSW